MGIFDGFAEGLASAIDDIRHTVVEQGYFGQQTSGNIELPQVEAPTIEPASTRIVDLTPSTADPSWGTSSAAIEPPIEPTSWEAAAQDIEPAQQHEPPQPSMEMEQ